MRLKLHWLPDRKFLAGGVAGLVTWLLTLAAASAGVEIPAELMTASVGLVMGAVYYLVPPSVEDVLRRVDGDLKRHFALEEIASIDGTIGEEIQKRRSAAGAVARVALAFLLLGALALGGPVACASYQVSKAESSSPAQAVYAIQADFNTALAAAVAYAESGTAEPAVLVGIDRLATVAHGALTAAVQAVRSGHDPTTAAAVAIARTAVAELASYVVARAAEAGVRT